MHRLPLLRCRVRSQSPCINDDRSTFSLLRMKALVFALVRAFEFELAVPAEDLIKKTGIVQRPLVRTEMEKGTQMPLIVKPYHRQ